MMSLNVSEEENYGVCFLTSYVQVFPTCPSVMTPRCVVFAATLRGSRQKDVSRFRKNCKIYTVCCNIRLFFCFFLFYEYG